MLRLGIGQGRCVHRLAQREREQNRQHGRSAQNRLKRIAPFGGSTQAGKNQEKTQGKAQVALRCAYRKRTAMQCSGFFSFPKGLADGAAIATRLASSVAIRVVGALVVAVGHTVAVAVPARRPGLGIVAVRAARGAWVHGAITRAVGGAAAFPMARLPHGMPAALLPMA